MSNRVLHAAHSRLNDAQRELLESQLPPIACAYCNCEDMHPPVPTARCLPVAALDIWYQLVVGCPTQRQLSVLSTLLDHIVPAQLLASSALSKVRDQALPAILSPDRTSRLLAG